jgi:hypothetical protein
MNQHPLAEVSTAQGIIGSAYQEVNVRTPRGMRRAPPGRSVLCCKRQTL